jgi:hypothetical protein
MTSSSFEWRKRIDSEVSFFFFWLLGIEYVPWVSQDSEVFFTKFLAKLKLVPNSMIWWNSSWIWSKYYASIKSACYLNVETMTASVWMITSLLKLRASWTRIAQECSINYNSNLIEWFWEVKEKIEKNLLHLVVWPTNFILQCHIKSCKSSLECETNITPSQSKKFSQNIISQM